MTDAPASGRTRKIIGVIVLTTIVFAGMALYADVQKLSDALSTYAVSWFLAGLALATANYVLRFVRWQYYLRVLDVRDVPWLESARIFVAGFVMSITPGKVGEVFKSVLLYESRGVPIEHTAPIVVAERLTDLLALVLLAAVGSAALGQGMGSVIIGGALVVGIWAACAFQPIGEFGLRIAEKLPVIKKIAPKLRDAYASLRQLVRPAPFAAATTLSVVSWFMECVSLYLIVRGFGVALGWLESTFIYSAPTILGAVALLPGGVGVTEASMTGLLESLGSMDRPEAIGTTLLVRIATLWWAVLLGVGALAWQRRALARRQLPD